MALSEKELLKELVGKVSGIGDSRGKEILEHEAVKGKSFADAGEFFDQLKKTHSGGGFGNNQYADNVLKDHFEKMEDTAEEEADAKKEVADQGESRLKTQAKFYGDMGKKHGGTIFVVFAILIFLLDIGSHYRGFDITIDGSGFQFIRGILGIFVSFIYVIGIGLLLYVLTTRKKDPLAIGSFVVAMTTVLLVIAFLFNFDARPAYHVFFILIFWAAFIKDREDAVTANWFLTGLLFADLFLVSLVAGFSREMSGFFDGIPILPLFVIFYVNDKAQSWFTKILIGGIVIWYVFTAGPATAFAAQAAADAGIDIQDTSFWEEFSLERLYQNAVVNPWQKISVSSNAWLGQQIQYAITGKVEQNQYEQLGVYLEDVKSAQPRYYGDEEVVIWGSVKAKTLDDPINIDVGCYVKDGLTELKTEEVHPNNTFSVFTLEEQDFACTFNQQNPIFDGKFRPGSKTITTFADFNFETLAFLKVYFMDLERLRAMTRENLDPLQEFGIQDKKPVAVYTNGPIEIGMETTTPLLGVSDSYLALPRFSLSFQNKQGWEGKLTNLSELILLFPKGITIDPATDCNKKFKEYKIGDCKKNSCEKFVNKECLSVCNQYSDSEDDKAAKKNCVDSCKDQVEQCVDECGFLFEEEGEKYSAYSLDMESLEKGIRLDKDYEKFQFFSCRFNAKPSGEEGVLGNTPITTKSFRVKLRYDYTVEKPITVKIEKDPSEARSTKLGGVTVIPSSVVGKRVIELASASKVDPLTVFALASQESSLTHCCKAAGQNKVGFCTKSDDASCELNRLISSGSSYGIMQLNSKHCAWFNPEQVCTRNSISGLTCFGGYKDRGSGGWKEECDIFENAGCEPGQDAKHLDCNVKIGLAYMEHLKVIKGDGPKTYTCGGVSKTYSGWDKVLRYYNGWACKGADLTYVEKINAIKSQIKTTARITDLEEEAPKASESLQSTQDTTSETSSSGQTSAKPPTGLIVTSPFPGDSVTLIELKWALSSDDVNGKDVVKEYNVWRKRTSDPQFFQMNKLILPKGTSSFPDGDRTACGVKYYVEVIYKNENSAKSKIVEYPCGN